MTEYKLINEIQLYTENLGSLFEYIRLYSISDAEGNIKYYTQDALLKGIYTDFIPRDKRDFDKGPDLKLYYKDGRKRVKTLNRLFTPDGCNKDLRIEAAKSYFGIKGACVTKTDSVNVITSLNDPYQEVKISMVDITPAKGVKGRK